MEGRLQVLIALHRWSEPALLTDVSPLWLTAPLAFALHCPGLREVHRGTESLWGDLTEREKVKMPPGSTPVVHFTMCMSRDRRGEVSKAVQVQVADVTISKTPQSLLWCLVSKRWAAVLLWNLRAHYCLLFKQWWVGLTALFQFFSTHIYKFNTVLHSFNCLLLLTPMEGHRNSQSCKNILKYRSKKT